MPKISLIPKNRGLRLRPYMRYMKEILFLILLFLFLVPIGFYAYTIRDALVNKDYVSIGTISGLVIFSFLFSVYLSILFMERTIFFSNWDRLARFSRFLFEHNYVYEKKNQQGQRKFKFPRIYLKQKKYDLEVSFELAGSKFQEKFKKIGGDLETTFAMDFMETEDDERFKMYRLAYSALKARINTTDVRYVEGRGIELMKDFYWDFISDPHMMVVGGTGGGKTVLLRTLILCLAKIGVVDICDPKRADFATMAEMTAFEGRVFYDIESIVSQFEESLKTMEERYDFMRSEQKRLNHTDMKSFAEYGLEPYFLVCDEYNALKAMLDYKQADRLDRAFGQLLLLGRQAGCFAIVAMQKPAREDLGSKLQANINFRIAVGRLDEMGYDVAFEEVNRTKDFKFMKYVGGMRVFGRGYAAVKGQVAREFYSPNLIKGFVFADEYNKLERKEHKHNVTNEAHVEEVEEEIVMVEVPPIVKSEPEEVSDLRYSINDIVANSGFDFRKVKDLVLLLQESGYRSFEKDEKGHYTFTLDETDLVEDLLNQIEDSEKTKKDVLADYFLEN